VPVLGYPRSIESLCADQGRISMEVKAGTLELFASRKTRRTDLSTETYYCTDCGGRLKIQSVADLRPCPRCENRTWQASEETRQTHNHHPRP
jgi:predicted RNA-binding Zn-ribbon protein involved in translation (DUF1610 family)